MWQDDARMPASPDPKPSSPSTSPSRWWAVPAALLLITGLWWTQPQPRQSTATADAPAAGPTPTPAPATTPATSLPAVALTLTPLAAGGSATAAAIAVPRGTAQVRLRLTGDLPPADELTAEISAVGRDAVRRWPVDDAEAGADGATRAVAVPPYEVPPGEFTLTLWAGDADVVQRYAFRIDSQ